ncbi:hypothetical protein DRQ26_00340 [bacterium]|nr:MAG: hypothetical protein DRQ26_00340 [bacterium]
MKHLKSIFSLIIILSFLYADPSSFSMCYTIPEIYENLSTLVGDTICVTGDYTTSYDSMLVNFYYDWLKEEPMPPHTKAKLIGLVPSGDAECGGYLLIDSAIVFFDDTLDGGDTLVILDVLHYSVILGGSCLGGSLYRSDIEEEEETAGCDSCKFAIIVSGGEKLRHWKKLLMMYKHKLNNGYCPENIYALFGFLGNSREPDSLSDDAVDPCDMNNIRRAHQEIAHKVAECHRNGKAAKVQKLFDEHGSPGGSIYIWENWEYKRTHLPAETLLALQQMIVDSSLDSIPLEIEDEFVECYGGSTATVINKGLRLKNKTRIHGNANAGTTVPAYGSNGPPWDKYLSAKLAYLDSGYTYDEAVKKAQKAYREWIESFLPDKHDRMQWYRGMIACIDAGTTAVCSLQFHGTWYWATSTAGNRNEFQAKLDTIFADSVEENGIMDSSGVIFKKCKFHTYCETLTIVVPPGDQITIEFPDSVSDGRNCGNITVYEDTASSPPPHKWVKRKIWNWNNRGSYGYETGHNRRVITTPSTGTGRYKIHNDDHYGGYTVSVGARQVHTYTVDSPSDVELYANASFGWSDLSFEEFNPTIIGETWYVFGAGLEGFDLSTMPAYICPRGGGVGQLTVDFGEMGENEFWDDMEIWLNIIDVPVPGMLEIMAEGAEFPYQILDITTPGIYTVHLGSYHVPGIYTVRLGSYHSRGKDETTYPVITFSSDASSSPSFAWVSWALRTIYDPPISVDENKSVKPKTFAIHPNYPDPFNSTTVVSFDLPEASQVRAEVFDISGKIVYVPLAGGVYEPGTHRIKIDMSNFQSGIYFVKISTKKYSASERIILVK